MSASSECRSAVDRLLESHMRLLVALKAARNEIHLMREKDGAGPYDPTLRARIDAAIAFAEGHSFIEGKS